MPLNNITKRIYLAVWMLISVFIVGSLGYYLIGKGKWDWLDCIYMTVITLGSVGYREIFPATPGVKIFTIFLIVAGMSIILYATTSIIAFIIEGDLSTVLWRRRMDREINKLKDHFIVCGGGKFGTYIADELKATRRKFVLIEIHPEIIEKLKEHQSQDLFVLGDAMEDKILLEAGIDHAKGLVCATDSDQKNLFIAVAARSLNHKLRVVSRVNDPDCGEKFLKIGVDSVVSPQYIGALRLASELMRPTGTNFLDTMMRDKTQTIRVEEIPIPANSPMIGKTLGEGKVKEKTGLQVLGIKSPDSAEYIYNPQSSEKLSANNILVVYGEVGGVQRLQKMLEDGFHL